MRLFAVTCMEGLNKGKVFPANYERIGDKFRICGDHSGAESPADFKTVQNTKPYLGTYNCKKE